METERNKEWNREGEVGEEKRWERERERERHRHMDTERDGARGDWAIEIEWN